MSDKNEREEAGKTGINTSEENLAEHVDGVGKLNSDTIANNLIDELIDSEVKFNSDDIVAITKRPDGKIVWIENGNEKAGLEHIYRHSEDFAKKGIEKDKIKSLIIQSLEKGEIIGYQGKGEGRPIYKVKYEGEIHHTAITVGSNGFVVGANPASGNKVIERKSNENKNMF